MTTVFAYHRVADYDFWRAGYARAIAATPEVRSYRIWRGQDDPNYVITAENFDSREVAERVWTSEETKTAMEADGIDMLMADSQKSSTPLSKFPKLVYVSSPQKELLLFWESRSDQLLCSRGAPPVAKGRLHFPFCWLRGDLTPGTLSSLCFNPN